MAIFLMLGWWYGRGWLWILQLTKDRLKLIAQIFAVKVLLVTWFSPWKQIYEPNTSFSTFFKVALDNLVSRFIGFIVRTGILLFALFITIVSLIFGVMAFLAWPLIPLLIFILPVLTVLGVG